MNFYKNCKKYYHDFIFPGFLRKAWFWFCDPHDVKNMAMINFFSYNDLNVKGFFKKEGLTSVINLDQDIDSIWNGFRNKFTKIPIKNAQKRGIVIKQDKNFKEFKAIYYAFRKHKKLSIDRFKTFEENGILFSAYNCGKMIAGRVYISNDIYIRGWVSAGLNFKKNKILKRIVSEANKLILWEAIQWSKKNKYKFFDLGGISPDSKDDGLRSLAEFKESFGGVRTKCFYYHRVYSKLLKTWIKFRK